MKVFLNGQILEEKEATISVADHGFLYGDAVFETLQFKSGAIINLDKHITRLNHSAQKVLLEVPEIDFEEAITNLVIANNLDTARIRVTLSRGANDFDFTTCKNPTLLITTTELKEARKDFTNGSVTCSIKQERPVPDIKTTQILPSILARQKAHKLSCDECFFITHDGKVAEGSYSNFFAVKNGVIYTPPLDICLNGTIRKTLFEIAEQHESIVIKEANINYNELKDFDEAFWTNAVVHIAPIKKLDSIEFKCPGEVTNKLIRLLQEKVA